MAIGTGLAVLGASAIGAGASIKSGKKAAKAQTQAVDASVAEQRRQYDLTREDFAPWREAGQGALSSISSMLGLAANDNSISTFEGSPGYEFRLSEGVKAIERSAAARGMLNSGATGKALIRYGQNLASEEYMNEFNRRAAVAGLGQAATANTAGYGQAAANNISNAYLQAGDARASSYLTTGSAINNSLQNAITLYGLNKGWFGSQAVA